MKMIVKLSESCTVEVEGVSVKDMFAELAAAEEVLGITSCGACHCTDLKRQVRTNDGFTFYELQCTNRDCRARLAFGQPKENPTRLFPRRKGKDGNWLPNGGWERYSPPAGQARPANEDASIIPF